MMNTNDDNSEGRTPGEPRGNRLTIRKPRDPDRKPQKESYWCSPASARDLANIRAAYRVALGREASLSVITRRALKLLADRLAAVESIPAAMDAEVAALMREAR